MGFDSSRFTFNPWDDFLGVVMQQGRVQVDADWNEWLAELNRRLQAGTLDMFGRAVVPKTTPEGFHITTGVDGSGNPIILVGPGRIYVDGLLAENHGTPAPLSGGWVPAPGVVAAPPPAGLIWDTALAELVGTNPVPFNQQPYLPGVTFPTKGGPYLVYVDVWQREVTYLEDPDLVEKAVGVDTTGRLQTVWQVKYIDLSKVGAVDCATPDGSIPDYSTLLKPPAAQLTTGVVQSTPEGVCCLTPNTGYTGLENQLYRVEIHQGGPVGKATFKWSRDNASVETGVTAIRQSGTTLVVQSLGRDDVLRFSANDWIEITDDYLELAGLPGEIHQIKITDPSSTITLTTAVNTANFPVDANNNTDPKRHTRIKRWDEQGKVFQSDRTTVWRDLDAAAAGDIPVPPAGTTLLLENGVTVAFSEDPAGADFAPGQFWSFAARSTDGTVEFLDAAPPRGIHHHYARLSVVTLPGTASDCRTFWPPDAGECCCCTVNVEPRDVTGATTLQSILDKAKGQNASVTICLAAGTYSLPAPLYLTSAHQGIRIEACEQGLVTLAAAQGQSDAFRDGLVVLDGANDIELHRLSFAIPYARLTGSTFAGLPLESLDPGVSSAVRDLRVGIGVRLVNVDRVTIDDCAFSWVDKVPENAMPFGAGIFANGTVTALTVERSTFTGGNDFLAGYLHTPSAVFNKAPKGRVKLENLVRARVAAAQSAQTTTGTVVSMLRALRDAQAAQAKTVSGDAKSKASVNAAELLQVPELAAGQSAVDLTRLSASQAANGGTTIASVLDDAMFQDNEFSQLSIGIFVFGASGRVDVSRNTVTRCRAGVWFLSLLDPSGATLLAEPLVFFGLSMATGYPLPKGDASATQSIAAAPSAVRVYTGTTDFTDSTSSVWTQDAKTKNVTVSQSKLNSPKQPPPITGAQPAASDQALYQNERVGPDFTYTFSGLTQGFYTVLLKFAEIADQVQGDRIINTTINGQPVIRQLDLIQQVGAATADDLTFVNIVPQTGSITVELSADSSAKDPNAKVSAVQVTPQWSPGDLTGVLGTGQQAELMMFYIEIGLLAQQGFSVLPARAAQLRIEDNEMKAIATFGVLVLGDDLVQKPAASSLLLNGNRIEIDTQTFLKDVRNETVSEGTLAGRLAAISFAAGSRISAAVVILLVTRCVVDGNLLVNQNGRGQKRLPLGDSLLLFDSVFPSPTATVPPPELCISGNVLQGPMIVVPERFVFLPPTVPFPMNFWAFLNSMTV